MLGEDSYIHTYLADFAPTADERIVVGNLKTKENFWEIIREKDRRWGLLFFVCMMEFFFLEENASYSALKITTKTSKKNEEIYKKIISTIFEIVLNWAVSSKLPSKDFKNAILDIL